MALYDNYAAAVETPEQVTNQELAEENAYVDAIMRTDVMRTAHRFLAQKGNSSKFKVAESLNNARWLGLADTNTDRFKQVIKNLWFGMYSRAPGSQGSSGFEHVFLGEQKNGISGLHSWLRYNQEEASGNMEYLGFIKTVNVGRVGFTLNQQKSDHVTNHIAAGRFNGNAHEVEGHLQAGQFHFDRRKPRTGDGAVHHLLHCPTRRPVSRSGQRHAIQHSIAHLVVQREAFRRIHLPDDLDERSIEINKYMSSYDLKGT
jgi:hypothetical protein